MIKYFLILFLCLSVLSNNYCQIDLGCSGHKFEHFIDSIKEDGYRRNAYALKKYLDSQNRNTPGVLFQWPLRAIPQYQELPNYYTISNYLDQDLDTIEVLDYNCGEKTYDGHRGIDITLFPFMWHMMDEEYVEVLAAADGLVTTAHDTEDNDYNCMGKNSANTDNNTVIITHADGSYSVYYHILSNSIVVNENDIVNAGDKIALVASSGVSTGPHLHFGVRDANENLIEPFAGSCNDMNAESWWANQKPYWNERVNRVMCHYAEPQLVGYGNTGFCDPEHIFAKNNYMPGDNIFYGVAMVDIQNGTEVEIDVYNSNGNSIFSDSYTHNTDPDNALYLVFNSNIPSGAPNGTYKVKVDIGQDEYYHYFTVNCPSSAIINNDLMGDNGFHAGVILDISSALQEAGLPLSYENTDLKLQSGTEIKLAPGFHAPAGTYVWTRLRGCNFTH